MSCKRVRRFIFKSLALSLAFSFCYKTFAQQATAALQASYRSDADALITLDKVSVLPFTDNMQGIYARPLEAHFIALVNKMHRWDYVPSNTSGLVLSPDELEASPEKAKQASSGLAADGFFAARVSKGPNGVIIHLSLFLANDGKLISQAILKDYKRFDLNDLKTQMERLLSEITQRIPYSGRVLSRDGNRVTVNLGSKDGVQPNQMLSVIQVIQLHRHPKFNFLIKTEKEVLGKVKVLKVDETLSFGVVVNEKERDAIQKGTKIGSLDFVNYSVPQSLDSGPEEALSQREDSGIAFGRDARMWKPQSPASFGQVGGRFGISRFNNNLNFSAGTLEAANAFAPIVQLDGELWITPELTFAARLKQGVMPTANPRSGSSPKELSQSLNYYEASLGYRLRLGPYVWSPHLEGFLGYFNYQLFVDNATPEALTSMNYSGFKLGVRGVTPIGGEMGLYGVGGEFNMAVNPRLREVPVTSGGSSTSYLTQFGVFGFRKVGERLRILAGVDVETYSTTFTGSGTRAESASSSSHRYATFNGGVTYMF